MSDSHAASTHAASAREPRGRPVGTGIDDSERLALLRARLAADPKLKPTTAIKALGITDPSSIRRLRDKLKRAQGKASGVASENAAPRIPKVSDRISAASETAHVYQTAPSESERPATTAAASTASFRSFRKSEEPPRDPPRPADHRRSHASFDPLLVGSLEFAIRAWATAMTAQLGMMTMMLQNPFVRQAMQQQITFNEMIMGAFKTPAAPRR